MKNPLEQELLEVLEKYITSMKINNKYLNKKEIYANVSNFLETKIWDFLDDSD